MRHVMASVCVWMVCAACTKSASGPAFVRHPPQASEGTVYIYRPSQMSGGARTIFVAVPTIAGKCYELLDGGYIVHVAPPGVVTIGASASGDVKTVDVTVEPGTEKFVKVAWGTWGGAELAEVSAQAAVGDLRKTHGVSECKK